MLFTDLGNFVRGVDNPLSWYLHKDFVPSLKINIFFERERERETSICFFMLIHAYSCIHWLILVCALTKDRTHNLGISGRCSDQLCYLARV